MTITEIARLAGVSISTVSKIVNNKDEGINPQTRSRVLQIVKEYNYTPYGTVKNLSAAKKFLLGVLLAPASHSQRLISGILDEAQEHGYAVLLLNSQGSLETEAKNITVLCSNGVDGVLWEPVSEESDALREEFTRQNIPFCLLGGSSSLPSYRMDYPGMGYTLTKKLLEQKHTNVACLLKKDSARSLAFYEGFQKCLYDHQIPLTDKMRIYDTDGDCCQAILDRHITGIASSHFASSLNLYERMNRLHYRIPADLSLVSLKADVQEAISFPHISFLPIPFYAFGRYVAGQLIQECEKTAAENPCYLFAAPDALDSEDSLSCPSALRTKPIVVVGPINLDVTFTVDELPQHGKTTYIQNSTSAPGGKGTNQAIGVAKLGHEAALIGETGTDADSSFLFLALEKAHVNTQGIHRDPRRQTGKAYIYTESDGESSISLLAGANGNLQPEDIRQRQFLFTDAGYCLISTELPTATAVEAARTAKRYGVQTIVKPSAIHALPEGLLENTDIFVPNRMEASVLCPSSPDPARQADFFLQGGAGTVIITLGHDGCFLKTAETEQYFQAASDFIPMDTTGGADAFIAALASYLSEGYALEKAIRIATYAAGFCISRLGIEEALADKNTLETHIAKKEAELLE